MSFNYDYHRETLAEIINKASTNATYVIPDLQRQYVWTPQQVITLIDSIFRGWPFGSLLLWEVKPDSFQGNEGIPPHAFWQLVDRTENGQGIKCSEMGPPATYQMVLDGQQRVQSVILALGGDQWGFKLPDSDWAFALYEQRMKSSHWSKASLCVDLVNFEEELKAKNNTVRKIEVRKILAWAILDSVAGHSVRSSQSSYVGPLLAAKENPGRFIRLSRFWNLVQKDLVEREYRTLLDSMLMEHGVANLSILLDPLAEFMKIVENVKANSVVHSLQIKPFVVTPQWSKDDYSDAIVNIFTRLNTAGRELKREEITLAWLKTGWISTKTEGKSALPCLEELRLALEDCKLKVQIEEIVRLISFVWSVEEQGGKLLDSKDLLKGEIVKPLGQSVACKWLQLMPRLKQCADLIKERDLHEHQGSFNAIIVILEWYRIVFDRFEALSGEVQVVERDRIAKRLAQSTTQFLDRWLFGSHWANVWSDGAAQNFQKYATDLSGFYTKLKESRANNLVAAVDDFIEKFMGHISDNAIRQINVMMVRDRRRVHDYYSMLWVWHRLEESRWRISKVQMLAGKKWKSYTEVDHTVAHAWWERLVNKEIERKLATFDGTDDEKALVAPDEFETKSDAVAFINLLGNCSLLNKSFNISKNDAPMWKFLQDVHEFREGKLERCEWEIALSLSETMTDPEGAAFTDIIKAIKKRDNLIKMDLRNFITGDIQRVDSTTLGE
ncbi:MAG: DUF262 domain-containing protein [Candidatus Riflebacteria bacterium]|nr:DUF262 domain-containing protein [Candidatus Riflebacteria bacterium]